MKKTRVIRKYQNRKLYDTETKGYVNITDIVNMVQKGDEVMVVDMVTKADITSTILVKAMSEAVERGKMVLTQSVLVDTIKQGVNRD